MKSYPKEINFSDYNASTPRTVEPKGSTVHATKSVQEKTIQNTVGSQTCGPIEVWLSNPAAKNRSPENGIRKSSDKSSHAPIASDSDSRYCFAPLQEEIWINWKHRKPELIKESKLELFCRIDGSLKKIWTKTFAWDNCPRNAKTLFKGDLKLINEQTDKDNNAGLRSVASDYDQATYDALFPDGCVTAEYSPYRLKLSVVPKSDTIKRKPRSVWMYFDVRVKLELFWGEEKMIPALRADGGMPTARKQTILAEEKAVLNALRHEDEDDDYKITTADREIVIDANVFKEGRADDFHNDFVETTKLWGEGPRIPVIAEIKVKKSDGTFDLCPPAVGNARFMWDWEDTDDTQANPKWENWVDAAATQETKDFLTNIFQATRDANDPLDSDNCPTSYGGKRAKRQHPFLLEPGYAPANALKDGEFPFAATACQHRKRAVFSRAWRTGVLAGKTGVLFQPSRIAGDKYKLSVYLYYDRALDDDKAKSATFRAKAGDAHSTTGFWEVFRRINLTYIKRAGATAVQLAAIKNLYKKELGMILQDATDALDEARYKNSLIKCFKNFNEDVNTVTARKILPLYTRYAFKDPSSQRSDSPAVELKSKDDFQQAVENAFKDYKVVGLEISNAPAFKYEEVEVNALVNGIVVSNPDDHPSQNLIAVLSDRGGNFQVGNVVKGIASKTSGTVTAVRASLWEKQFKEETYHKDREVKVVSGTETTKISWTPLMSRLGDGDKKKLRTFLTNVANGAAMNATVEIKVQGKYNDRTDRERRNNVKNYLERLFNERFVIEKKSLLDTLVQQKNIYQEYSDNHKDFLVSLLMQNGFKDYVEQTPAYQNKKSVYFFHLPGQDNLWKPKIAGGSLPDASKREKAIAYITTVDDGTHLTHRVTDNSVIDYKNNPSVFAHEIAHALFIPHAKWKTGRALKPPPYEPGHHVPGDTCIMNYDLDSDHFCGFCMLRLRGWDWKKMKTDFAFGVPEIRLAQAVGGKKSKVYAEDYPGKNAPQDGKDDFHFAPEKETVRIEYKVKNDKNLITGGKIELLRKSDRTVIWTRVLQPNEFTDGAHTIDWDGAVTTSADFPDGYATIEHSPYIMEISVKGKGWGEPEKAWTNFEVQLAEIELEWGPKSVLAASPVLGTTHIERDHQVWDYLNDATDNANLQNRLPAAAETKKVYLVSNTFYTDIEDMTTNAPYLAHKAQWGDGPNIPLFAKLLVKDANDAGIIAPKALGKISCLWEWEDMTAEINGDVTTFDPNLAQTVDTEYNQMNSVRKFPATGLAATKERNQIFNDKADDLFMQHTGKHYSVMRCLEYTTDYYSGTTTPPGLNCHVDRGGKRGANAKPVFPVQAGIAPVASLAHPNDRVFPFNVRAAANRTWSAISTAWRDGDALALGKTGVVFQPSRMAGDSYKINVYATYDVNALDQTTDVEIKKVPANFKASTGTFEVWREVHLASYYKKKRNVTAALHASLDVGGVRRMEDIDLTQIQQHYDQAYIRIADRTGGIQVMNRPNFIVAMNNTLQAIPWYLRAAVAAGNVGVDQYDNSDDGVVFKDYLTFVADVKLAVPVPTTDPDAYVKNMTPPDIDQYSIKIHQGGPVAQFPNGIKDSVWAVGAYNNDITYKATCRTDWGRYVFLRVFQNYLGVNRADGIHIAQVNELDNYEGPNGFSVPFPDQSPTSGFIAICGNKYTTTGKNSREQTLAHEIGHTLGLNHETHPAGDPRKFHDYLGAGICLMSYNYAVVRAFCGTCLLRLRGWSLYETDANGVPTGDKWQHRTIGCVPECNKQPGGISKDPNVNLQGLASQSEIDAYKHFTS